MSYVIYNDNNFVGIYTETWNVITKLWLNSTAINDISRTNYSNWLCNVHGIKAIYLKFGVYEGSLQGFEFPSEKDYLLFMIKYT